MAGIVANKTDSEATAMMTCEVSSECCLAKERVVLVISIALEPSVVSVQSTKVVGVAAVVLHRFHPFRCSHSRMPRFVIAIDTFLKRVHRGWTVKHLELLLDTHLRL